MREKGSLAKIVVHSRNKALPSLPIGIRLEGEGEEDWSSQLFNLEWTWREEPNKGGFECTILAHVLVKINPINIQNKKKIH
jgi:hypothetical protein